ncbi:uncharacterized protein LOC119356198 [Triticum dicoccoides]|uniref:DUF642 domain-containing protein n=2 Tax=Triticum TaxID=4564 RepID=A0A9R1RBU9_TRITD|nr:uncharacterized protein LOC119356198 [Triticum dicoccoides]XP_044460354.1 uncharacterized protein LOC123191842 [Triticum aestivum]VAH35654.1 unnamed protein product [Triticum turgidum subsp. durum]
MVVGGARCAAVLLLAFAAARAAPDVDGPLLNGNFEYPPNRSQMNGTRVTGAHAIPYWKAAGPVEYVESGTDRPGDGMVLPVPEGAHAVRLGSGASVRQQLSVTRGARYSVTFSAARTCGQSERLRLSVVPDAAADAPGRELPIQTVYSASGWDSYAWAFHAERGVVTLVIHHSDDGGGAEDPACGPLVDAVAIKTLHPAAEAAGGNLLRNGGFEEGPYVAPGSTCGVLVPPMGEGAVSPLPGWMVMSYSKAAKYVDAARHAVPGGSRAVELVAGVEAALVQEVDTVPGSACRMEFSVGDAGDGCVACGPELQPMRVVAAATGAQGTAAVEYHSRGTGGRARGALSFTAEGSRTRVVLYSSGYHTMSDGSGSLCGPVVDDVSLVCA